MHPEQPIQNPITAVDPGQKWYLLLLPHVATELDIAMLKVKAYEAASLNENLELAEQLWIRIIAATSGQDLEALRAYAKITRQEKPLSPTPPPDQAPPATPPSSSRSTDPQFSPPPVRPPYQREEIRLLIPLSTPVVQTTQPTNSRPQRKIPWIRLIIFGLLYAIYGMLLAAVLAPFWAVVAAGVVVMATVQSLVVPLPNAATPTIALFMFLVVAWAIAAAIPEAWIVTMPAAIAWAAAWAAAMTMAWAMAVTEAVTEAVDKLLAAFSRFHAALILAGTSLSGLGLGWLAYGAFKAAIGR